jgi:hypothetical protein
MSSGSKELNRTDSNMGTVIPLFSMHGLLKGRRLTTFGLLRIWRTGSGGNKRRWVKPLYGFIKTFLCPNEQLV